MRHTAKVPPRLLGLAVTSVLVAGACTGGDGSTPDSGARPLEPIPQPVVPAGLPVAPESERVDTTMPTFSDPTDVTNPLFPVSLQESVLLLGRVDGEPFRTEVTLLPDTRIIEWEGRRIETLVSQYVAYLDGRLQEVAYDYYAQADDGSVWYLGEDVADFDGGAIVTKEGTWLAGKDGPAAMIMPAEPVVGDVHRTENIPGIAFEEVTITSVDRTLDGPIGPIGGGLIASELHNDGTVSDKIFAPGYGEFLTEDRGDVEALALAVPTDALAEPVPTELSALRRGVTDIFDGAEREDRAAVGTTLDEMTAAWAAYPIGEVPRLVRPRITRALRALAVAVGTRDPARTRQAALDAAQWILDLHLLYRPPAEIDLARLDLWAAQLQLDVADGDADAVSGDLFTIMYIRDRILQALQDDAIARVNVRLGALQAATLDADMQAVARAAERLRDTLAAVELAA